MAIKLYMMNLSPPSRAVMMCARTLGLELELKPVNLLAGEHLTPEFLEMNPVHTVPVLDDDGFILIESRTMLMYLADKYMKTEALYPKDIKKRAICNQKLDFDYGTLYPAFKKAYYPIFMEKKKPVQADLDNLDKALGFLEIFLSKTRYSAGENLTIADLSIVASLSTIQAFGHSLEKFPLIADYFDLCKGEIKDYQEVCGDGAKVFGDFINDILKSIQ